MEASVLLLNFLFYSGVIIPLSSGCSAGKSTKFWICFADIRLIHFHSLNTSCKYNFFFYSLGMDGYVYSQESSTKIIVD